MVDLDRFDDVRRGLSTMIDKLQPDAAKNCDCILIFEAAPFASPEGETLRTRLFVILAQIIGTPKAQTFVRCIPWCQDTSAPLRLDHVENIPPATVVKIKERPCLFSEEVSVIDCLTSDTLAKGGCIRPTSHNQERLFYHPCRREAFNSGQHLAATSLGGADAAMYKWSGRTPHRGCQRPVPYRWSRAWQRQTRGRSRSM